MPKKVRRYRKKLQIKLIEKRSTWMLTLQGWMIAIALIITSMIFILSHIHPFLAVTSPISTADVLVVEGWMADYAVEAALNEFQSGSYRQLVTTGVPVRKGYYLAEYNNFAEITAETLKKLGLEEDKIIIVPSPEVRKDRTYASAVAVGQWLEQTDIQPKAINIVSESAHARRSWLLYKKALASKVPAGIISTPSRSYDSQQWWKYSAGVRSVINETVGYLYALLVSWRA
ncbi:MAG: ElyC/SanA/YdcF family protein [Cyanobacteria bacterium P01_A01_bin.45]